MKVNTLYPVILNQWHTKNVKNSGANRDSTESNRFSSFFLLKIRLARDYANTMIFTMIIRKLLTHIHRSILTTFFLCYQHERLAANNKQQFIYQTNLLSAICIALAKRHTHEMEKQQPMVLISTFQWRSNKKYLRHKPILWKLLFEPSCER